MPTQPSVSRQAVGRAMAQLMPTIVQGLQLEFFVKRNVTQTQFLVLMALRASGSSRMSALAQRMQVALQTATGIVTRLVKAGLVRRFTTSEDRRQVMVELTPKGEAFIRDFQAVVRRRWEEVVRALTPRELIAFFEILNKLQQRLAARA